MNSYTVEPFISKEEIAQMIQTLAKQINIDYQGEEVLLVGLLRGSVIFLADLVRELSLDATIDFMVVSSYGNNTESSRDVKIVKDLQEDIKDRNVIVVEDIIDTGHTLKQVVDFLTLREPKSLKICTLLDKPQRREVKVKVDYTGRTIPDKFVVGYGIDYAQKYRTLPDIRLVVFKEDQ